MKKLAIGFLFFQVACTSSGFNRGELKDILGVEKPVYSDSAIEDEFKKKANLPKLFKLAVYFKNPKEEQKWRWESSDKKILEDIARDLKAEGIVSDVFPLVSSVVESDDLKSLRLAAAKHHADALMVVSGAAQIKRGLNNYGWSYALLLPMFFVPASQTNSLFVANATIWDVRNEYIYLTVETENAENVASTVVEMQNDIEIYTHAKTKALAELKSELIDTVKGKKL